MLTETDFEPIIAGVPSFQTKWLQWKKREELCGPVSVDFSFYMTEHLIQRAAVDDFTDFTLLFDALEVPLSNSASELYECDPERKKYKWGCRPIHLVRNDASGRFCSGARVRLRHPSNVSVRIHPVRRPSSRARGR
jgi:hypothetical protein